MIMPRTLRRPRFDEYDITAAPNDFNVLTIYTFLELGSVRIPGFQRNYVWTWVVRLN